MTLSKFIQWADYCNRKLSVYHVILLNCLFALISVVYHHGGILHSEMFIRLPYYLSDTPLLGKLFDSDIVELGFFRARELSFLLDFIDCKFIELGIENGFPHFLSLTHYLFSIASGCLLWLFCVKELNLKPLTGIGLLALFWTSPGIFLGGAIFRAGKMGVALLAAILFYVIYKVAFISMKEIDFQISKKVWFLYAAAIFTITFLDEQGLFIAITIIVFLSIWGFFVRNRNIYTMLLIGVLSILLHALYRYSIAPQLTFLLNGYWPDVSYISTMPLQYLIQNPVSYLLTGSFLYLETFRYLTGNPPLMVAFGLLILFIIFPVFYLYTTPGLSNDYKKFFTLAFAELLITNVLLVIAMMTLMLLKKPELISLPDIKLTYYFVSANVIMAMTLAILTNIICQSRIPGWFVVMVMCFAIAGNIAAIPKNKAIMAQGHLHYFHQTRSAFLNSFKNPGSSNDFDALLVKENMVLQFIQSKKKKPPVDADDYVGKGIFYTRCGQYRKAIRNFNQAIIRSPDDIHAYIERGNLYAKIDQSQKAIEDFNKVLGLKPDVAVAYYIRGYAYLKQGNKELGCPDAQKACALGSCGVWERAKKEGLCQ
jgi:tetratricopeptide (TPR) repeat protein